LGFGAHGKNLVTLRRHSGVALRATNVRKSVGAAKAALRKGACLAAELVTTVYRVDNGKRLCYVSLSLASAAELKAAGGPASGEGKR